MATSDRTPPSAPQTIFDVVETDLAAAREDAASSGHAFYGTPLALAWGNAVRPPELAPILIEYPNPVDNAVAIAHLCREVAALKGVKLPTKYGDDPDDGGAPPAAGAAA